MDGVVVLGLMATTILIYSRFANLFSAIYSVQRRTYGDILYALSVVVCALLAKDAWIYTSAVLLMAVADGGAAVVGNFWGKKNSYLVFGRKALQKSWAGTGAHFLLAVICMAVGYWSRAAGGAELAGPELWVLFAALPLFATLLENITPYGIDNLTTPIFTVLVLNFLA